MYYNKIFYDVDDNVKVIFIINIRVVLQLGSVYHNEIINYRGLIHEENLQQFLS